jgi:hypothetical protein
MNRGVWVRRKPRRVRDENDQAAKDGECLEQDVQTSSLHTQRTVAVSLYVTFRRAVVSAYLAKSSAFLLQCFLRIHAACHKEMRAKAQRL